MPANEHPKEERTSSSATSPRIYNKTHTLREWLQSLPDHTFVPDEPFVPIANMQVFATTRIQISSFGEAVVREFDRLVGELNDAYKSIRFLTREMGGTEDEQALKEEWSRLLDIAEYFRNWLASDLTVYAKTSQRCSVELRGEGQPMLVNGYELPALTTKQYQVISLLVEAFPGGATKRDFEKNDLCDAHKILSTFSKRLHLRNTIILPGKKGAGGYRLAPYSEYHPQ